MRSSSKTVCSEIATDSSRADCLYSLFTARAIDTPAAVAVVGDQQQITYDQLNHRANQVAHMLRRQGVGPDVLVGLCLERSVEMIIGLLGVIKAGGCYVPLDPTYPPERLALIVHMTGLQLLLTSQNVWTQLPAVAQAVQKIPSIIYLDQADTSQTQASVDNPESASHPDHLLYLLFTSGSTGTPKGVTMPHRALINLLQWQQQQCPTTLGERTLQFTPLSFDVATQEIFSTLCFGGTLVLVADPVRRNPQKLWQLLQTQAIERLFLPFVALQQLAEAAQGKRPDALKTVITAGEQLQITPAIAQFFQQPGCTLHNHYGPTESHVVTAYTLPANVDGWPSLPPIGYPIEHVQIFILDEAHHSVPTGEVGELYIGGVCLAHGYYNNPDLTRERFVPNPFGPGRLYKTGDLARYLPDGALEYVGRSDNQIKIRGFRVEPGEIEVVLASHPAVRTATVLLREAIPGRKDLVAYVVLDTLLAPIEDTMLQELRDYLSAKLPDYMVPPFFVPLDELPVTPSGKVDRRALPSPEAKRPQIKTVLRLPRTDIETRLARAWQTVLHLDVVGIDDNFFELGGTSLLITQLHTRLTAEFPILETVDLLQYPTISALADHVHRSSTGKGSYRPPSDRRVDRQASISVRREQRRRHRGASTDNR